MLKTFSLSYWLGRLSVSQKLTLIYLLDLTAVIYVSSVLIQEKYIAIDFARKEIVGANYAEAVQQNLLAAFDIPPPSALPTPAQRLQSFKAVQERYDPSLHTGPAANAFARCLQPGHALSEPEKAHLIDKAHDLLTIVGNESNLILDPDLDSYYVMSITLLRFPELMQVEHDMRQFIHAQTTQARSQKQKVQLLTLVGRLDAALQGLSSDYAQVWLAASPQLKQALQSSRNQVVAQAAQFGAQVQNSTETGVSAAQLGRIDASYQQSMQALSEAWNTSITQLKGLLQARIDNLFSRMWQHLGTALLLLISILSLVYLVASQIAKPLKSLAKVADAVRKSADYSHRAQWHSGDEIGQLFRAFNDMLAQLDHDRLTQQELAAAASAAQAQQELLAAFPIPLVITAVPEHEVLHVNQPGLPWLQGCTRDPWRSGLEPTQLARFFQRLADHGVVDEFEVRWLGGATPSWAVLSARRINFQGRDAIVTAFTPINKLKFMEQRLELWAKVFEASSESIIIMDESRHIISVNKAFCRSTAYDLHEVVGQDIGLLLPQDAEMVWKQLREKESWQGEVHIRKLSGESYPAWLMVSSVHKNATSGEVVNYIGLSIDITDRKAKEERINFLAQHDVLTELPNRALCKQRLALAMEQSQHSGDKLAVLFIDLDRFKYINDTLGHHIGDALLRKIARRLCQAVRSEDTVSRLGGDEFVVIMRQIGEREELIRTVNQRLIADIREPAHIEGHTINVSCSIGVAIYPDDAQTQDELMRKADAAMYEAKSCGRDNARFFSEETDHRVKARRTMESQLRQALEQQEFSLHYQPRLNARSRKLQGAEALLRWDNPLLGRVAPMDFIQLAEETGLIMPIGLWVLRQACCQWMQFQQEQQFGTLDLSVNLSAAQLADPALAGQLQQILHDTGLPPEQLELELTESHLMHNPQAAQEQIRALKALGVRIALDDFGTGYSSLAYLKHFQIDKLKIDKSFVQGMLNDSADAAIVHAVIALGHTLGYSVVAEGVENAPTAQTLTALGCDELQGYYFSKPLNVRDFSLWVEQKPAPPERRKVH